MYLIFRCSRCGRYLYAEEGTGTRTCPCGKRIVLRKARVVTRAEDAREASEMVRSLQLGGREMTGFS